MRTPLPLAEGSMSVHSGAIIGGSSGQLTVASGGDLTLYRLPKEMYPFVLT